jgi:hypothetical protein
MPKETSKTDKNGNLGSFVDVMTPEPKIIVEDFIDFQRLTYVLESATPMEKSLIERMIDMVLGCDRKKQFLSLGEQFAFNTLIKQKILV